MKRFLTLLLAAAMVLSFAACGDNGTTIRNENGEDNVKKDPIAAQYLQDLAVKTADYPVLPAMPNESELDEAFSTIDYDKMGADAYEKAQEKIWEDWDARSNAYYDALKAMGVTDVFDFNKADFSPLVDKEKFDESVAVTQVQHAARVKVDEKGCEAAAFTAVTADDASAMPEELPVVEMNLNRPFAFMITGVDGLPLFLGTVNSL